MWVVALAPLAFIFFFSFGIDRMSAATARTSFLASLPSMGAVRARPCSSATRRERRPGVLHHRGDVRRARASSARRPSAACPESGDPDHGPGRAGAATIVNIFLASSAPHWAISLIGVLIFAGLTAYDMQKLKKLYLYEASAARRRGRRAASIAARSSSTWTSSISSTSCSR